MSNTCLESRSAWLNQRAMERSYVSPSTRGFLPWLQWRYVTSVPTAAAGWESEIQPGYDSLSVDTKKGGALGTAVLWQLVHLLLVVHHPSLAAASLLLRATFLPDSLRTFKVCLLSVGEEWTVCVLPLHVSSFSSATSLRAVYISAIIILT